MPPSPASKKRKTEIQVVESVGAYETNVKGETDVLDSSFRENDSPIILSEKYSFSNLGSGSSDDKNEHPATTLFRDYLRIKSVQPDPDYG